MNPVPGSRPNPVLLRYLAGQESLEKAATELAEQVKRTSHRTQGDVPSHPVPSGSGVSAYEFSQGDLRKVRLLFARVEAMLEPFRRELINKSAREYLKSAGDSAFDHAVRLLANDVTATLGEQHVPVVWSIAGDVRQLDYGDPTSKCVEDVQQYFQDTFVDTTWPACPRHPNHPLDFAGGSWRCPRDGVVAAPLGALTPRSGDAV